MSSRLAQGASGGVDQFKLLRRVVWVSEDGSHLRVHGDNAGIPVNEVTVGPAPKASISSGADGNNSAEAKADISVLLRGKRLEISADVDSAGLSTLQDMLAKYAEILKLVN